ncbi:hypothetical protein SUTH_00518 [Sulfuritalea hydrogenivorans sk43H]|uniref:Uncharacterized protein n=1 Tax=Sulfuritalea hydrogenivorans sk43H TaxID=1223802 RepID=W0SBS2_9PROT|nr:hypothetical protein SUTH_00518 [Sulfuritalea hydrogenivorans sk43H]
MSSSAVQPASSSNRPLPSAVQTKTILRRSRHSTRRVKPANGSSKDDHAASRTRGTRAPTDLETDPCNGQQSVYETWGDSLPAVVFTFVPEPISVAPDNIARRVSLFIARSTSNRSGLCVDFLNLDDNRSLFCWSVVE